jgi:LPS sulfotransferase NodH
LRDLEKEGAAAQLAWSTKFLTPPLIGPHRARGFNVKIVHTVDQSGFAQLLREKKCRIFHMLRRNRVKAVVSRINGSRLYDKTGMWGMFDESNRLPPLTIDPVQFDEYLKHREKVDQELEDYIRMLQLPTFKIFYEDLQADEKAVLSNIFSFLEVEPYPVKGKTLKITSDDLQKAIMNFSDIRANYVGTQYESMFDEVIIP